MIDNERTWHADFLRDAVGCRIMEVRALTDDEIVGMGWGHHDPGAGVMIILDSGLALMPMSDPEGNGPGFVEAGTAP